MADNDAPVIVEQLSGERRRLELHGANLPDEGMAIEYRRSLAVHHLPDAPHPEIHDLGVEWPEIQMSGVWDDYVIRDDTSAASLEATGRALWREGRRCRFTWGDRVSFLGYVTEFAVSYQEGSLLDWRVRFQTDATDDAQQPVTRRAARKVGSILDAGIVELTLRTEALRAEQVSAATRANVIRVLP